MTLRNYSLIFLLLASGFSLMAQSTLWKDVTVDDQRKSVGPVQVDKIPAAARTITLHKENMQDLLWEATYPQDKAKGTEVQIPNNKGEFETFEVFRKADIFAENLVDKYGETIRAFTGHKVGDPYSVIHMTMGYGMFNAVTYRPGGILDYVEYASVLKDGTYLVYRRGEAEFGKLVCGVEDRVSNLPSLGVEDKSAPVEQYVFRLQLTTSASFSGQFGDGTPTTAEMQTVLTGQINNILNPIYNRDFGVVLQNATHDNTIFLTAGANTPFSDEAMSLVVFFENGVFTNTGQPSAIAGVDNTMFDVGHAQVFANSGGLGAGNSVCNNGPAPAPAGSSVSGQDAVTKALGMSGITYPLLNDFTVDYVAHEIGHQFGCNHTYATVEPAACNTGHIDSRYEVGSGTTIMAYVGVCSNSDLYPDNKLRSDPYFHSHSIDEALSSIQNFFLCGPVTAAANAADPVATPSVATMDIPMGTPFALVGTISDSEGSPIAAWNQFDLAANDYDGGDLSSMPMVATSAGAPQSTNTSGPLFRFAIPGVPVAGKVTRILPSNGLQKGTQDWEILPTVARPLNFRLLARDNQNGAGMFGRTMVGATAVTVTSDGPMQITNPEASTTVNQGDPVNIVYSGLPGSICSEVDAFLSTDGGATYMPAALAMNVGNSGFVTVTIPAAAPTTTAARVVLQCHTTDGTLLGSSTPFQVSDNFTIKAASLAVDLLSIRADAEGKTNVVTWTTANEIDNEGFDVQRSTDGANWRPLGFVGGRNLATAQNYQWIDQEPLSGTNYYRLNSRDLDGTTELSQVVSVTRGTDELGMTILPNPAQDHFEVSVNGVDFATASSVSLQVYTVAGKLVYDAPLIGVRTRIDASALASGVYFVRLTHGELTATRKLLVQ